MCWNLLDIETKYISSAKNQNLVQIVSELFIHEEATLELDFPAFVVTDRAMEKHFTFAF